jgi:anti-sigma regulatory factor (Ser/Thr protein kinase)
VNAYAAGDQGLIKLSIQTQHGKLEIRIRDFGIPKDVQLLDRQLHAADTTDYG